MENANSNFHFKQDDEEENKQSNYLTKLELLNKTGYFMGLNPKKFYDILKYNYKTANDEEKKFMDDNCDLYLDRYKNGIVQTNLTYKKINAIYNIIVVVLVIMIISFITIYLYYYHFVNDYNEYLKSIEQFM